MTYPGNLPATTVVGILRDEKARPLKSALMTFTLGVPRVVDPTSGDFFYKTTDAPTCTTDATTGAFTVNLLPTNDPDESPLNWTWMVHVSGMDNATSPAAFTDTFQITVPQGGGTVELAAVIQPAASSGVLTPLTLVELADFDNTTPATNNQVPVYNSTSKKWAPGTAGSGLPGGGSDGQFVGHVSGSPAWQTIAPSSLTPAAAVAGAAPASHAASHAIAGSDPLTPTAIGAATIAQLNQLKGSCVFYVEDYGAVGDGTTDDTAAVKSCIAAALGNATSTGNNYAEVRFQAKTYLLAGSLVQGGSTFGNAIIPLPIIAMTANVVTLVFRGAGENSALPIWLQTTMQKTGTVIKTTVSGTNDATFGEACVIGGPNRKQGYGTSGGTGTWNNMQVVVDGIQMLLPADPHICGWDFDGTAQAIIKSADVYTNTGVTTTVVPTTSWQFGIRMPSTNNQSLQIIDRYSVEGCCYGVVMTEHTVMRNYYALYCLVGIQCSTSAAMPHSSTILYANVEWCQTVIQSDGNRFNIYAHQIDIEVGNGGGVPPGFGIFRYIADPSNLFRGYIGFQYPNDDTSYLSLTSALVEGGKFCRIIDLSRPTGAATAALTVPATTVPARNTYYRDAFVVIAGAGITAIKVDAQAVLAAAGAVMVPAGKYIELDYTSTATWIWTLL